jgi:hypothetical protein
VFTVRQHVTVCFSHSVGLEVGELDTGLEDGACEGTLDAGLAEGEELVGVVLGEADGENVVGASVVGPAVVVEGANVVGAKVWAEVGELEPHSLFTSNLKDQKWFTGNFCLGWSLMASLAGPQSSEIV